jgi:predicted dehydrogenase
MRIGIAGLNGLYWPVAAGNWLAGRPDIQFLAAASLGEDKVLIKDNLGVSPEEYAAKYGIKLYTQAEEMIAAEKLDTVMIVTRHSQHANWVERLAPMGVNLYIPKTFVTNQEDADRIVKAGKTHGVKIAVGPSARFLPQMAALKTALAEDRIGTPFAVRICHHHGTIDVFNQHDFYRDAQEGGPELSLGWYGIDLALQFMQERVSSVYAKYGNYTSPNSPFMDCGRMVLGMEHGGTASFDMYFCNRINYPSWQVEITGPKGVLSIHRSEPNSTRTVVSLEDKQGYTALSLPDKSPQWEMFWVDEFVQGRQPSLTAEYAREVTLISFAARESAKTGKTVTLPA